MPAARKERYREAALTLLRRAASEGSLPAADFLASALEELGKPGEAAAVLEGAAAGSADLIWTLPRLDGRRLQTLAVKAPNGCRPSPHLSSESGWKWNSRLAVA